MDKCVFDELSASEVWKYALSEEEKLYFEVLAIAHGLEILRKVRDAGLKREAFSEQFPAFELDKEG